jgi:hypothetical protein
MNGKSKKELSADFVPAVKFKGSIPGYVYKHGAAGMFVFGN